MRRVTAGASQRFVAATDELENGTPVVSVMGEVDRATAQALEQTLLEVADDRAGELIVDLSGCSFLDTCGLRALLVARERFHRQVLVLANPNVIRVFQLTKTDGLFDIYPTVDAAVNGNGAANGNGDG